MDDLEEVVRSGDLKKSLEAIRDFLAAKLVEAQTRETAAVAKQLVAVLVELDHLPVTEGESASASLAHRYAHRVTGPESQPPPGLSIVVGSTRRN